MQTRRFQNIIVVILALMLAFAPVAHAAGENTPVASDSNAYSVAPDTEVKKVITAITDENGVSVDNLSTVTFPVGGEDLLYEKIMGLLTVLLVVEGEDEPLELNVSDNWITWISSTIIDSVGEYTATVDIPLPEDCILAEGIPAQIVIPYTVEPVAVAFFEDISNQYAYAFPMNGDWDTFFNDTFRDSDWEIWLCATQTGGEIYLNIAWEDPKPDVTKAGVVMVTGQPVLADGVMLAEGIELPTVQYSVSIQDPSNPDLNCWGIFYNPWGFNLPWALSEELTELADNGEIQVLVSTDGGETWSQEDYVDCDSWGVNISTNELTEGTNYQIKAVWEGGSTGVFSFTWDGSSVQGEGYEGDRDGGDGGGNPNKPVTQPAPQPEPESEPEPEPEPTPTPEPIPTPEPAPTPEPTPAPPVKEPEEPFYEEVTDTYSLLSGTRLLMMRESGAVRFSKQGVTVTLSEAVLDAMALTDSSRFFIELTKEEQGFVLITELDDVPLTALPDTVVFLPCTAPADGNTLSLQNDQGEVVCTGNYDPALGVASFTVQSAGSYTVVETSSQPVTQPTTETPPSGEEPVETPSANTQTPSEQQAPAHEETSKSSVLLAIAGTAVVAAAAICAGLPLWKRRRR